MVRQDIGGKTGTTNDSKDTWFSGYDPGTVTTVLIGFNDHRRKTTASGAISDQISGAEGGTKSAQLTWDDYVKIAQEGIPEEKQDPPPGVVTVTIDKSSGKLSDDGGNSRPEYFIDGTQQPKERVVHEVGTTLIDNGQQQELF